MDKVMHLGLELMGPIGMSFILIITFKLSKETDDAKNAKNKLQELERLLVEKYTTIQSLKQSMLNWKKYE